VLALAECIVVLVQAERTEELVRAERIGGLQLPEVAAVEVLEKVVGQQ
jgi:hypothetical protein